MSYDFIKKYEKSLDPFPPWKFCFDISSWRKYPNSIALDWNLIEFDVKNKDKIPSTPGIYAFFIKPKIASFPENAYLIYIGKAGDKSENNLRKRFGQYLSGLKQRKRAKLTIALNKWKKYIYFCYSEINDSEISLGELELQLNDALVPPLNERDFSAEVIEKIKILR